MKSSFKHTSKHSHKKNGLSIEFSNIIHITETIKQNYSEVPRISFYIDLELFRDFIPQDLIFFDFEQFFFYQM
jgi:hypothetical protein